jgi:hypothetical protein
MFMLLLMLLQLLLLPRPFPGARRPSIDRRAFGNWQNFEVCKGGSLKEMGAKYEGRIDKI